MGNHGDSALDRARDAAERRDWPEAFERFVEADRQGLLDRRDRALFAQVAYVAGHLDRTIEAWERIHAESAAAGDDLAAAEAAMRVALHLLMDTAMMAPIRGWVSRSERHLGVLDCAPSEATPVHAWLAVVRNYERLLSGDFEGARVWARRAIELGGVHDRTAEAIGRVAEARGLVLMGEVERGLAMLEESGVAAVSGEIDPLSGGIVYCELICAFQALAHVDLADEWTTAWERWCPGKAPGSMHGRCRIHRAEILRFRGKLTEAEEEAERACEALRPYLRRELGWPLCELGRIRLRRGDLDAAEEAFLAAHDLGWEPQPGVALVHLARGDHALAASSIRDAIARPSFVPSKEFPPDSDLRRFPLLEAQVEIGAAIKGAELAHARAASAELTRIAGRFKSKALDASATVARARVLFADGDAHGADRAFDEGARLWHELGAPYEAAMARAALAEARRAIGHAASADLESRAARSILERLGAAPPSRASSAEAASQPPAAVEIGASVEPYAFVREGDTWAVTFDGRAVRARDRKGLHYLARLLAEPEREFHVLDLVGGDPESLPDAGDAGPAIDAKAKEAYRRRLADVEEDIAEAERNADLGRAASARAEREILARELARAYGAGGRERPGAGAAAERARASVTRATRQAIARIADHHPELGAHLDRTIKTGVFCTYFPDPITRMRWLVRP